MFQKFTLIVLVMLCSCRSSEKEQGKLAQVVPEPRETIASGTLSIPVYDFEGLQPLLNKKDETIYVINFWATWCAPCLKELPYLEQVQSDYRDRGVQVILVSLDMPRMWETHLLPFVMERNLKSMVVVLDDPKQNTWIPLVHESWTGAIPATLIYDKEKREFYEGPVTYESLNKALSNFKI